jgi:hypothetical protein
MLHLALRTVLFGAAAFGALASAPVATAAPKDFTIGGSYQGAVPGSYYAQWESIHIKNGGQVTGAVYGGGGGDWVLGGGSLTGRVTHGAEMTLHVSESGWMFSRSFDVSATVSIDSAGDLVGTTTDGVAFTWRRR